MGIFLGNIVLQVLSFVAENECINIRQRLVDGIAAAKMRSIRFERPNAKLPQASDPFRALRLCQTAAQHLPDGRF